LEGYLPFRAYSSSAKELNNSELSSICLAIRYQAVTNEANKALELAISAIQRVKRFRFDLDSAVAEYSREIEKTRASRRDDAKLFGINRKPSTIKRKHAMDAKAWRTKCYPENIAPLSSRQSFHREKFIAGPHKRQKYRCRENSQYPRHAVPLRR